MLHRVCDVYLFYLNLCSSPELASALDAPERENVLANIQEDSTEQSRDEIRNDKAKIASSCNNREARSVDAQTSEDQFITGMVSKCINEGN